MHRGLFCGFSFLHICLFNCPLYGTCFFKRGILHWRSFEKDWVLWFQHVKDKFVLPTLWSEYSDLQGEDEARMKHYIALHLIKCCHWDCQLAPQVFGWIRFIFTEEGQSTSALTFFRKDRFVLPTFQSDLWLKCWLDKPVFHTLESENPTFYMFLGVHIVGESVGSANVPLTFITS